MPCRYCYSQCILYYYTHCDNYRQTDEINFKFKLINKKYIKKNINFHLDFQSENYCLK